MNRKRGTTDLKKSKVGTTLSQIHHDLSQLGGFKRHGDSLADPNQKRRPAFGDITNALNEKSQDGKKDKLKKSNLSIKPVVSLTDKPAQSKSKEGKSKKKSKKTTSQDENGIQLSQESSSQESVISSSQESIISSSQESTSSEEITSSQESLVTSDQLDSTFTVDKDESEIVPEGVDNVDAENKKDIAQVAVYANFIFNYYKERELKFMVPMYMDKQPTLTSNMRGILVDWLVEVQENFELNHETLYLAVKLVDSYLTKQIVTKEGLQLVGAVALFVACKFDERCPPLIEDFLYICDDAYTRDEFIRMEISLLKTVDFDIGMPLSYRFLRRYAKCARVTMETLTLARFVLETSLMDYEFIKYRESKMASACLLLAMKMKNCENWEQTMEFYTGYTKSELLQLSKELNTMIANPPRQLTTIKSKYSHKVFYEVAKTQPLSDEDFSS